MSINLSISPQPQARQPPILGKLFRGIHQGHPQGPSIHTHTPQPTFKITAKILTGHITCKFPALTGDKLPLPITDSLYISYHICKYHPHRPPPLAHESVIRSIMMQLHKIYPLPLSVPSEEIGNKIPCEPAEELLATDTSPAYRQALGSKGIVRLRLCLSTLHHLPSLVHGSLARRPRYGFFA